MIKSDVPQPQTETPGKRRCFLVMSQPRCGTHLLRGYLDSHPEIHCDGEIYHFNQRRKHRDSMPGVNTAEELYSRLRDRWPDHHFGALVHDHFGTPEFQATYGWSHEGLPQWREKPLLIWLSRENRLAQYASWLMARRTNRWMRYRSSRVRMDGIGEMDAGGPPRDVHCDPGEFLHWLESWQARRDRLRSMLGDFDSVAITYEALCRNPARECGKIFARLGVAPVKVEADTLKQRGYRLPEVFGNFEEIIEAAITRLGRERLSELLGGNVVVERGPR